MSLLIVIFSLTGGFMYAIEPSNQDYCAKEAQEILTKFQAAEPATSYYGGCIKGSILLNIKMSDS